MYQNIFITPRTEDEAPVVYIWDDKNGVLTIPYKEFDYAYRKDPKGTYTSIYGHRLKKVTRWNKEETDIFESDVPRETKVLTDLYLDSDEKSEGHNVGFIDIEVSSEGGFPNVQEADKEIYCIGMYNQNLNQYVEFLYNKNEPSFKEEVRNDVSILHFPTEEEMLEAFMAWYSDQHFTILTGWNIATFDIPYIFRRIRSILGENTANMLSPIGLLKWNVSRERYQIAGVSVLDYLEVYKKFTYSTRPTYRLAAIGQFEVKMTKIEYDGTLDDLYKNDLNMFVDYNIHDVRIVVEIDKKKKLIELVRGICHAGHVPYEDYMYSSKFIEGTILVYLHRKGIICPNKPIDGQEQMDKRENEGEEGFAGAFVKEPIPGLYDWVFSLDLQSLYPSILMTLNISPETKVGKVYNWNLDDYLLSKITTYDVVVGRDKYQFTQEEFLSFMKKMKFTLSSNGILYLTDQKGIVPEILDKWFKERLEYKNLMKKAANEGDKEKEAYYDQRQHIQKIFLNSIYGVLGLPIFRFYDIDNALAVTATGQDVIKSTAKIINNKYKFDNVNSTEDNCIYIDTDSVYFSAVPYFIGNEDEQKKKETCVERARFFEKYLNELYTIMAKKLFFVENDHRFVIKGEVIAKTGFWVAKKRYAMLKVYDLETNKDKNEVKVKGLDVVRSSFPPAFGKFMSQTLEDILRRITKEDLDKKIISFKNSLVQMDYLDIARNTSIKDVSGYDDETEKSLVIFKKGTPAHVKAAITYNRYLKNKGLDTKHALIKNSDKIKYVYLKRNPLGIEAIAVKGFDDPKEIIKLIKEYIDYDRLFENELRNKLDDFYSALNWGKIPTEVNQNAVEFFTF